MDLAEKIAVQKVLVETFQALEKSNPTMLLDVLLQGTGPALVNHALSSQEAYSRKRADTLKYLLQAVHKELLVSAPAQVEEPEEESEEVA